MVDYASVKCLKDNGGRVQSTSSTWRKHSMHSSHILRFFRQSWHFCTHTHSNTHSNTARGPKQQQEDLTSHHYQLGESDIVKAIRLDNKIIYLSLIGSGVYLGEPAMQQTFCTMFLPVGQHIYFPLKGSSPCLWCNAGPINDEGLRRYCRSHTKEYAYLSVKTLTNGPKIKPLGHCGLMRGWCIEGLNGRKIPMLYVVKRRNILIPKQSPGWVQTFKSYLKASSHYKRDSLLIRVSQHVYQEDWNTSSKYF